MDLDKLKETWQNAEIKPVMNDGKIQQILDLRGKHAFNRIQQYEKIGFTTSIILIFVGVIMIILSYTMLNSENIIIPIFITLSSIFLLVWNIYKKHFFKRIDIARMSILSFSKAINTYKRYLAIEGVIAFIWTVTFAVTFVSTQVLHLNIVGQIIFALLICTFSTAISYLAYKYTIVKDLKTIGRAIKEAKDFEKENIE